MILDGNSAFDWSSGKNIVGVDFLRKIFNAWVVKYSILFNNCDMHDWKKQADIIGPRLDEAWNIALTVACK